MKKKILFMIILLILNLNFVLCQPTDDTEDTDYTQLVTVPGGTYTQSDPWGEHFVHTISTFELAKYETTYELWYTVYQWAIDNDYSFRYPGQEGDSGSLGLPPTENFKYPVVNICWNDAIVWCNAYSEMSSFTPVYYADGSLTEILKDSYDTEACSNSVPNWSADGYRLPTEGEWQYAASYVDGETCIDPDHVSGDVTGQNPEDYSWYDDNIYEVGTKLPNQLDIYDMSGNTAELCWDVETLYYPEGPETDYTGPETGGERRSVRGWFVGDIPMVGIRSFTSSTDTNSTAWGFRVTRRTQ